MNKLILDLLKENGRVIIPDFGALIVKQKSPYKFIFNEFLQYNDGALISALSESEKITQEDATAKVKDLVTEYNKKLNAGDKIELPEIGSLSKSPTGKITLSEVDVSGSEIKQPVADSPSETDGTKNTIEFDLQDKPSEKQKKPEEEKKPEPKKEVTTSKSQPEKKITPTPTPPKPTPTPKPTPAPKYEPKPVTKTTATSQVKTETKEQQKPPITEYYNEGSSRNWKSIILWIILIIIVNGAILGFFFYPEEIKAFLGRDKEEVVVDEIDELEDETMASEGDTLVEEESIPLEADSELVIEEQQDELIETQTEEQQIFSGTKYFVVAGVFREESNAEKFVVKLRNKGYNAEKFGKIGQMHAVSYDVFQTKQEADNFMMKIKREVDKEAWVRIVD
jgi:nucleoid DNA-binding protein